MKRTEQITENDDNLDGEPSIIGYIEWDDHDPHVWYARFADSGRADEFISWQEARSSLCDDCGGTGMVPSLGEAHDGSGYVPCSTCIAQE